MTRRISVPSWVVTGLLLLGSAPARAQLQVTDNIHVKMNGSVTVGYEGSNGNQMQSSHSDYFGVNGDINGYYYHPNFLAFDVLPLYGRQQSNQDVGTTNNSEGYTAMVRIFGGSPFPGSVSFSQGWNSNGTFGFAGAGGLVSNAHNQNFGISWSELLSGMPTLTVSYGQGSDNSELLGTDVSTDTNSRIFSVGSSYRLLGFNLNGRFDRTTTDTKSPGLFVFDQPEASDTTNRNFQLNANHKFPLHGTFSTAYSHNTFNSDTVGSTTNGTNDNANALLNFNVYKFPVYITADYTSNLTASIDQQLLASGAILGPATAFNFGGKRLLLNASTSYTGYLPHRIVFSGYFGHSELLLMGDPFGYTQFGGNLGYNFARGIKGLTLSLGVFDVANKYGNLGASIVGNANYQHQFGKWDLTAQFGHDQSVETLGLFRTVSSFNYGSSVRRPLGRGFRIYLGGGGGHTGFGMQPGTGSGSEYGTLGLSWRRYSLTGNYTQSSGASIMTAAGLVNAPPSLLGALANNKFILYNATSYGANLGIVPTRKLVITGIYRKFNSDINSALVNSGTVSSLLGFRINYRLRKLSFQAGSNTTRQTLNTSAPGVPQLVTSYYFGISRWFNVF